jgi:hypothetical protein
MDRDMQHIHGNAAWTWSLTLDMDISLVTHMLLEYGPVQAPYPCPSCLYMFMLHVPVHGAWICVEKFEKLPFWEAKFFSP